MSWFVRPDTTRLTLSDGQWILVKKRLNSGEQRAAFARIYVASTDGSLKVNPLKTGIAQVTAFLLDWSLTDDDGKPVMIRELSMDALTSVLDNLEPDRFTEIKAAIEAHEMAMLDEREKEKNVQGGGMNGPAISASPSVAAVPSNTSVN